MTDAATKANMTAARPRGDGERLDPDAPYEFSPNETYKEIVYRDDWKRHRPPEYAAYRELWDDVPRNKIELDFPIHLDIETTNICNLLCPMCTRTEMVENDSMWRSSFKVS